jgi:hypothetical protein
MIQQFLIGLISFSGLLFGLLLRKIAPEEIPIGTRTFTIIQYFILFFIMLSLLYRSWFHPSIIIGFPLGMLIARYFRVRYFYLGIALSLAFMITNRSVLFISSLIFLYGLPYGTLLSKQVPERITRNLLFFLVPFMLLFMQPIVTLSLPFFLSLTAGALFLRR